jgi:hypothetical protein
MWPWKPAAIAEEPVLTNEILNDIIEALMRIDANVQTLLSGEEQDDEED